MLIILITSLQRKVQQKLNRKLLKSESSVNTASKNYQTNQATPKNLHASRKKSR